MCLGMCLGACLGMWLGMCLGACLGTSSWACHRGGRRSSGAPLGRGRQEGGGAGTQTLQGLRCRLGFLLIIGRVKAHFVVVTDRRREGGGASTQTVQGLRRRLGEHVPRTITTHSPGLDAIPFPSQPNLNVWGYWRGNRNSIGCGRGY